MKTLLLLTTVSLAAAFSTPSKNSMNIKKPYTVLILMNATPKWLALTRDERTAFYEETLMPVFLKAGKSVKIRIFDSEYFHFRVSDFMIITAHDLDEYKLLIERLRDTKVYSEPYFEIMDIIVGQENLFEDFNEILKEPKK